MDKHLPSTDSTQVDLVALRNWHFLASMDKDRQPEMRRWHAKQSKIIGWKLAQLKGPSMHLAKIALVEFLSDAYRANLHAAAARPESWEWESLCSLARERIKQQDESQSTE